MGGAHFRNRQGFSVVEVLVALGVAAFLVASIGGVMASSSAAGALSSRRDRALGYARETLEKVSGAQESMFVCPWQLEAVPPAHQHLVPNGASWALASGDETVSGDASFQRWLTIENQPRVSGGPLDPKIKQVTVTVSWTERTGPQIVSLAKQLTGWRCP